jgi:hypothetical protein
MKLIICISPHKDIFVEEVNQINDLTLDFFSQEFNRTNSFHKFNSNFEFIFLKPIYPYNSIN